MKKALYVLIAGVYLAGCSPAVKDGAAGGAPSYQSFGAEISAGDPLTASDLLDMEQDSVYTQVKGKVVDVCQVKGCWMKLDLGNNETMRVTFKDYGFFVPKDSKGKEVVMEGLALRKSVGVDELRHYAEDAGKTAEEIAQITEPQSELTFEAVGVLMK